MLGQVKFVPENLQYTGYRKPKTVKQMKNIYGYDTEQTTGGELICAVNHKGDKYEVKTLAKSLLYGVKDHINLFCYGIQFEINHILKQIPEENRNELRSLGKTTYDNITYTLRGKNYLGISRNNQHVYLWDIAQFYGGSLKHNSERYLSTTKIEPPYDNMTKEYAKSHHKEIVDCCIQHADLTYKLTLLFFAELDKMNIKTTKLYSTASVAAKAFHQNCVWDDSTKLYRHKLDFVHAFQNAYAGGMFINPFRGSDYLYSYDVVSMYPYHMTNLKEIKNATYTVSTEYQPKAYYAALLCIICVTDTKLQPVGLLSGFTRYYPAGRFSKWITLQEYNFLVECGYQVQIMQGYWVTPQRHHYPFRKYINQLIELKSHYKGVDDMKYNLVKLIMNSMYGKFIQLNPNPEGTINAGTEYNPVYAGYITACARIQMCRLARKIPGLTFAVHTDSIITNQPIPDEMLGDDLGALKFEREGPGCMIAPGMYEISTYTKTRSFNKRNIVNLPQGMETFTYKEYFETFPKCNKIKLQLKQVLSWKIGTIRHNTHDIGRFIEEDKVIHLNHFNMRIWQNKTSGNKLLNEVEESYPYFLKEIDSPQDVLKFKGIKCSPHYHYKNKTSTKVIKPVLGEEKYQNSVETEVNKT